MIENENDILRRVRKIEIKTRGLSNEIFAGKYHTAFRGQIGRASCRERV